MKLVYAFCTVAFGVMTGAAVGYGLEFTPLVSHLFIDEMLCGALAGFVAAQIANLALELDADQRPMLRALSVAAYGSVMGMLLAVIWWGFDLEASLTVLGAINGFLSGMPAACAYGFLGGEAHALGYPEAKNLMSCLGIGLLIAFMALDEFDIENTLAVGAICAAIPAMFGGRINPWEHLGD